MKRIISLFWIICVCIALGSLLVACDDTNEPDHTHVFEKALSNDDTYHWYACEDETCVEPSQKAEHSIENGVCSVCGYEQSDLTPPPTPSANEVTENEFYAATSFSNVTNITIRTESNANIVNGVQQPAVSSMFYIDENRLKEVRGNTTEYVEGHDSYVFVFTYDNEQQKWIRKKLHQSGTEILGFKEYLNGVFYEDFSYEDGFYVGSKTFESGVAPDLEEYTVNYKLQFENGTLVSLRADYEVGEFDCYDYMTFTDYNTTTVNMPTEYVDLDSDVHTCVFEEELAHEEYLIESLQCGDTAIFYKSCRCGLKGTATFTSDITLGHSWSNWISNEDGTHSRICGRNSSHVEREACCGGEASCGTPAECEVCNGYYGDYEPHSFVLEIKAPEYLANEANCHSGKSYFKSCACGACGWETFSVSEPLGCIYGDWTPIGNGQHKGTCQRDNSHWCTVGCSGGEGYLCQGFLTCSVCGQEYGEIQQHRYIVHIIEDRYKATDATCQKRATYYHSCECGEIGYTTTCECSDGLTFEAGTFGEHNYVNGRCDTCDRTQNITYRISDDSSHYIVEQGDSSAAINYVLSEYNGLPVKGVSGCAFEGYTNLEKVVLPESITYIDESAFARSSIKELVIPNSINYIALSAFEECTMLRIYYFGNTEKWQEVIIDETNNSLLSATIYYFSANEPTSTGNYWYYDTNGNPVIWE